MINWIIGGAVIALTLWIVIRTVIKLKNGKSTCNCGGCDSAGRGCCGKAQGKA